MGAVKSLFRAPKAALPAPIQIKQPEPVRLPSAADRTRDRDEFRRKQGRRSRREGRRSTRLSEGRGGTSDFSGTVLAG